MHSCRNLLRPGWVPSSKAVIDAMQRSPETSGSGAAERSERVRRDSVHGDFYGSITIDPDTKRYLMARYRNLLTFDLGEDLVWCLGPDEGVFAVVPPGDEMADLDSSARSRTSSSVQPMEPN
jgi:hypothetical protein